MQAVAFDPGDRWSRLALASSFQLTTELDQAEATLLPLPDSDPDARAMRAEIAISRGNVEQAEALVEGGTFRPCAPERHPRPVASRLS